jgi:cell division septum initiation protein DivIVA
MMLESSRHSPKGDASMGKSRTDKYGNTREQSLIQENRTLKRMISSLRKQLARLDVDRINIAKEVIQECYKEGKEEEGKEILENLKKIWTCHKCQEGHMEIFIFNRGPDTIYYRICSNAPNCLHRTKAKIYTANVKGIMRKDKNEKI